MFVALLIVVSAMLLIRPVLTGLGVAYLILQYLRGKL
jgi:hypothetical protein